MRFIAYSDLEESAQALVAAIEGTGDAVVVEIVYEAALLAKAIEQRHPDVVFADLGQDPHGVLDALQAAAGGLSVFLTGPRDDSEVLLRALKLGVKEFLPASPTAEQINEAIESLPSAIRLAGHGGDAPVLAVMGAKGGVGATVVACQLAASLQALGSPAALVDLNCPLGDVALHLDLRPEYTLASVLTQGEALDATFLRSLLHGHDSGLQVLAAPERVEENELVRGVHVERVLSLLRRDVDWVVVDVARSWNEGSVRALDLATEILLVTSLDVASLAHTRQHLDLLRRLGHGDEKIHVIANRRSEDNGVSDADFESFVGRGYDFALPNDYATAVETVNGGKTLAEFAPKSRLALAFDRLARDAHRWSRLEAPAVEQDETLSGRVRRLFRR